MRLFQYISIMLCIFLIGFYIYQNSPHYQIIKGDIFGTYYNIKIRTDIKNKELSNNIKAKLKDIDSTMSAFKDDSELSVINKLSARKKLKLSPQMSKIMQASRKVYNLSEGWFDPSLGRLIDIWGFGPVAASTPDETEINKALASSGFDKIKSSDNFKTIYKTNSAVSLNLSAIAKGYAVDKISELLDEKGYTDYIVEIGGEIKVKGARSPESQSWNVGINKPTAESYENAMVVSISNISVATSGNYRNFYKKGGQIFSHTISHKTGKPAVTDALSVSVFHDSCMYADAYATAIVAMGIEKGLKFADKNKLKVIIFNNKFEPVLSKAAQQIFVE